MEDWEIDFRKQMADMINEQSSKQMESHYSFIRQLLTVSMGLVGLILVLSQREGNLEYDIAFMRVIIIFLSLCSLTCLVLLFGQGLSYNRQAQALQEYEDKVLADKEIKTNIVSAKPVPFFVLCERICFGSFVAAVISLVWYTFENF